MNMMHLKWDSSESRERNLREFETNNQELSDKRDTFDQQISTFQAK